VTQQNSALVEENAATAKTLEQQAHAMDQRVAFFRVDGNAAVAEPARANAKVQPMPRAAAPAARDKRAPIAATRRA
jgi:methyl-accepting chemotaxis protein